MTKFLWLVETSSDGKNWDFWQVYASRAEARSAAAQCRRWGDKYRMVRFIREAA